MPNTLTDEQLDETERCARRGLNIYGHWLTSLIAEVRRLRAADQRVRALCERSVALHSGKRDQAGLFVAHVLAALDGEQR
jgi:hypothetical protein